MFFVSLLLYIVVCVVCSYDDLAFDVHEERKARRWFVSSEISWICILAYYDVFLSVVSFLVSCIVLAESESMKFIFIELPCLYVCFKINDNHLRE